MAGQACVREIGPFQNFRAAADNLTSDQSCRTNDNRQASLSSWPASVRLDRLSVAWAI